MQFLLHRRFFYMDTIELYEIDSDYIKYLSSFEQHLFRNKKVTQVFTRKYIGIVLKINEFDYFAPLSSYKEKHKRLCETKDFIKVGTFSVINLNNMFPAPINLCKKVIIADLKDIHYRNLVRSEYRIIRQKTQLILQNAKAVYEHKMINDGKSKLSQRCNNFKLLEEKCKLYAKKI